MYIDVKIESLYPASPRGCDTDTGAWRWTDSEVAPCMWSQYWTQGIRGGGGGPPFRSFSFSHTNGRWIQIFFEMKLGDCNHSSTAFNLA